jgi:3-deoxy-manno-octulosonate cytidylyltransferase (CMP-KDO synthetase)
VASSAVVVIPARLDSTRLPRKVLADLCGRPLLWHVWRRLAACQRVADVVVATDAEEVADAVHSWGGRAILSPRGCSSGTARIAAILDVVAANYIVNVQADEPLIDPALVDRVIAILGEGDGSLATAVWRLESAAELEDPSVVKVARADSGRALFFSRSPIPFVRDAPRAEWVNRHRFWGHIGVYGYARDALGAYAAAPESELEQAERLEQLRFLALGLSFDVVESTRRTRSVDTADDLAAVTELLRFRR